MTGWPLPSHACMPPARFYTVMPADHSSSSRTSSRIAPDSQGRCLSTRAHSTSSVAFKAGAIIGHLRLSGE